MPKKARRTTVADVNGDFERYFAWHLQREHQRNHQAHRQDKLSLAV